MRPDQIVKTSSCHIGSTENGEMSHEEIEKVSGEQSRYPLAWPAGEGDRSITEETEGDPIHYALATRKEQQQSTLALARVFPVC